MAKQKDSFLIYYQFQEQVDELTDEEAGFLFKAIFHYEIEGVIPDFEILPAESKRLLKSMFLNIKKGLDLNKEKYTATCEKNRENGKLGGRPKKQTVIEETERFPIKPKKADNENEIDSEIDIDKKMEKIIDNGRGSRGNNEFSKMMQSIYNNIKERENYE